MDCPGFCWHLRRTYYPESFTHLNFFDLSYELTITLGVDINITSSSLSSNDESKIELWLKEKVSLLTPTLHFTGVNSDTPLSGETKGFVTVNWSSVISQV